LDLPPFKSDVERISVSGNWFIIDKLSHEKDFEIGKVLIK